MNRQNKNRNAFRGGRAVMALLLAGLLAGCQKTGEVLPSRGLLKETQTEQREESEEESGEPEKESREDETASESLKETLAEEYESPIDFEALLKVNPDVVAWVRIPGTRIDYPVVQAADNETYMHTSFEGEESAQGCIFLDCDSRGDFTGEHEILYGHHMRNGSMFADLKKYKSEHFFKSHPDLYLYLPEEEIHLKAIGVAVAPGDAVLRKTSFYGEEDLRNYVTERTRECSYREIPEEEIGQLFSFLTCSYEFEDARLILYAVRE